MAEKPNSQDWKDWLARAEEEVISGEVLKQSGNPQTTRNICLVSHQIVEKSLKALHLKRKGKLPGKIHELVKLASDLDLPELKLPDIVTIIRKLDEFYVPMKYPDGEPLPPWNLAVKALEDAKTVLELVKKLI
jgi:HEPN domain-containing protein